MTITIRAAAAADLPAIIAIMRSTDMFTPDELRGFAAMTASHFEAPEEGHRWSVASCGDTVAGAATLAPEMPAGVFNLLFLGVVPDHRRRGVAAALLADAEDHLRGEGARLLIVDTSSAERFAPARALYGGRGMAEVARIPDYWAPGEAKVTYAGGL